MAKGWKRSTGTETVTDNRYYLIENRQYVGYDATLAQGPYNFAEAVTRPNWVEFFKFQDGMLVWLVDPTAPDNNTSVHPGSGYALPVDASPNSFTYTDGTSPTNRREPFDATFGLDVIDPTCLHKQVAGRQRGRLHHAGDLLGRRPGSRRPSTTRWCRRTTTRPPTRRTR